MATLVNRLFSGDLIIEPGFHFSLPVFVFRSFKKKDRPAGFPEEFCEHALYGQQEGRR